MKMSKSQMVCLIEQGYLTLQISECDIVFTSTGPTVRNITGTGNDVVDMPDDWFMRCDSGPVFGRMKGYLHFSRKGYNANKGLIKTAFAKALRNGYDRTNGVGWPAFEAYVKTHFKQLRKAAVQKKKLLLKHLADIKAWEKGLNP